MNSTKNHLRSVGGIALVIICGVVSSATAQIKVACVGDSITAGYGLANPGTQSYPAQLQTLLGGGYTVNNFGNSGTTALKTSDNTYWNSWAFNSATNSSPNVVVIMFGANDSKSWNWNAANFNSDYRALISVFTNLPTHPKVFACYTPPMFLPTAFGTTFDPVFIENTVEPAIATIATQAGAQLIDNDTPLLNRPDLFQDGVHPTTAGAAIVAQQVYNAIKGLAPTNITTAAISSSLNPSVFGSNVTYTATLTSSAGTVTGAVVFAANNVPFSTNALSGGTASVTNSQLPIGVNVVAAQYVSQGKFLGSTRSLSQTVLDPAAPTLANLGSTAPTPGTNDISQLSTSGNTTWPDGINYFSNNNPPVGQTFTTGTNVLNLASIAIKTAGLNHDSNYGNPSLTPTYYLHIYSISGSTATLLAGFSAANPGFTDGAWLKWSGLNVPLGTNQTYAFTFGIPNDASWVALAVCSANAYAGGEIVTVPTDGGTANKGGSHAYDAVFSVGLVQPTTPSVGSITVSPWTNVPAGVQLIFGAAAGGAAPLYYQWQFDNGSGFVNLSGANTNLLSFVAAVTNTGSYRLVLTNSYGAVTSAPVALAVSPGLTNIPASMPFPLPTYGMNIGNKLELSWGAPNPAVLYNAAYNGFNSVRVPCAWNHNSTTNVSGGVTNYPINASYMAQVKQTVDAAIDAGMYVMINDHWDDGWLESSISTNIDATMNAKMKDYWTQIATTFAGYDNHLLFAAANEPNVHSQDEMKVLVYYYQTFVNAVRAAGGNNTNRWLVLQSVSDPTWMNALPTDTVSNRLMVEYHNYTPSLFSIIHSDQSWGTAIYYWGAAYHYTSPPSRSATWGEEYDTDAGYQQLADLYVSKGIPVMIGEFGASGVYLTNATEAAYNAASVLYWDKYLAESARVHGLSPFYWSTGNSPFDYDTAANKNPALIAALTGGAAPPPPNGAPYAASGLTATGGSGQVTLSWTAGSGATSYNLYRVTTSGGGSAIAPIVTGITGTSYTNTGLANGATYYYQVVAVNASGLSGFSPEAKATTSGTSITDPAQFNFESTSQGWSGGGGIVSGVAASAAQKFSGNQSLAVNFNVTTNGTGSPSVGNVAVMPGTTITFRVWIPSGSTITALQPYLMDNGWNWSSAWYGSFTPNAWNTLTLTVPANATSPLNVLGIQIMTSGAWTGTCYIDSVSWPASGPDFSLTASPANLTVNSGTNGASTITVTAMNSLNACYTLSVRNLPSGVSATFTNNPNIGGQSLLTLTASNTVISATTNVTVIATAGLISHTQTIALTLTGPTNAPPTLNPIANQTVNVGQTVAFTAGTTDTDQPPQTLTFALLSGATNATLNSSSGAFSFRPLVTQADSTNNFTLQVSDNGTPSLSATQNFSVVVNPLFPPAVSDVSVAGGQFGLSVSGQSGPDYAVETSTNLTQWSTVFITNSPALPFVWTDTNSTSPQRFYRVKLGPPLP